MKKVISKAMWVVVAVLVTGGYALTITDIAAKITDKGGEPNTK